MLSGLLIGGLLLFSAGLARADESADKQVPACNPAHAAMHQGLAVAEIMDDVLDQLQSDKVLTQEQVDKLIALLQENKGKKPAPGKKWSEDEQDKFKTMTPEERKEYVVEKKASSRPQDVKSDRNKNMSHRPDPLEKAVSGGIITQAQADTIRQAVRERAEKQRQERLQARLDGLVKQGTITNEQASAIVQQFAGFKKERQAEKEKIKAMSPEKRRELMKDRKASRINPLKALVEAGTLTQEQADQIMKALHQPPAQAK